MANRYTKFGGGGAGPPFSGCLLKIPVSTFFLRLGCLGGCGVGWSVNFDPVTGLRDDATLAGYAEQFNPYQEQCNGKLMSIGGDLQTWNRGGTIYARTGIQLKPGDVTRDTIDSIDLRDYLIGGAGQASLIVRFRGLAQLGATGDTIIGMDIGPDFVQLLDIPASKSGAFEVELHIGYDAWNGWPYYAARGFIDGLPPQLIVQQGSFDPTVEQTMLLTAQSADAGDVIYSHSCVAVQENTDFCPVLG